MPFTTFPYVVFFAALFFAYYAIPRRFQWWLLLAASMLFYGYASPFYLLLLWTTIIVTYVGTVSIGKVYSKRDEYLKVHKQDLSRDEKKAYKAVAERIASRWLGAMLIILLVLLGVFKYAQFAIDNFFALLGLFGISTLNAQHSTLNIILPVGLSFYLFQSIGYCMDVYREETEPERNLFKHALFVSYFPQLLQGPIGRYGRLAPQLVSEHEFSYEDAVFGIQRVAWGFFKKFMIANMIAARIDGAWIHPEGHVGLFCWGAICTLYAIQIYADFSGYMDIACGCSRMLGVRIDENFDCPYLSRSIPEFWRRWHMTLSAWFKDYLFYPLLRVDWNTRLRKMLGANKYLASVVPTSVALAVVWSATGLWHGASWGYVAWGVYYGVFMIANIALQPIYDAFARRFPGWTESKAHALFQMVRTFAIVVVGYSIFKPGDLSVTIRIWKNALCGDWIRGIHTLPHNGQCSWGFIAIVTLVLVAVDLWHYRFGAGTIRIAIRRLPVFARWSVYLVATWLVVYLGLYGSGFDQFEYFKF